MHATDRAKDAIAGLSPSPITNLVVVIYQQASDSYSLATLEVFIAGRRSASNWSRRPKHSDWTMEVRHMQHVSTSCSSLQAAPISARTHGSTVHCGSGQVKTQLLDGASVYCVCSDGMAVATGISDMRYEIQRRPWCFKSFFQTRNRPSGRRLRLHSQDQQTEASIQTLSPEIGELAKQQVAGTGIGWVCWLIEDLLPKTSKLMMTVLRPYVSQPAVYFEEKRGFGQP